MWAAFGPCHAKGSNLCSYSQLAAAAVIVHCDYTNKKAEIQGKKKSEEFNRAEAGLKARSQLLSQDMLFMAPIRSFSASNNKPRARPLTETQAT